MVEHHIQKEIITKLVECETARYADLKPANIEGNVFTYHLQSLMRDGLVVKNDAGLYMLTSAGKLFGINSSLKKKDLLLQAHAIILLSIRDDHGRWLLRRRLVQPMYGAVGFIHGEPVAGQSVYAAAAHTLERRTGMSGEFQFKGSGYICLRNKEEIISYTQFSLFEVANLQGGLQASDSHGENIWLEKPDFSAADMIPSMADLAAKVVEPGLFFADLQYEAV